MGIEVHLPSMFRVYVEGKSFVVCNGKNVGECIEEIVGKYPALREQFFDKAGNLKRVIEIYVNGKSAYPNELQKEIKDGDKIFVTLMLAGG